MERFPVLKALSHGDKGFKVLGIAVDKRQLILVGGTTLAYWILYQHLISTAFSVSSTAAFIAFVPVFLLAFLVAFIKIKKRPIDWWAQKKAQKHMAPRRFRWRHRPSRSRKPLRDAVQEKIPAEEIYWDMVRRRDGTYVMVLEVKPVSLSLVGKEGRTRVWAASASLYNRIDFPIVEIARAVEGNVNTYARTFKKHVLDGVSDKEPRLAQFARDHLDFLKDLVPKFNVYDRRGYLILPYKPAQADQKSRHRRNPGVKHAVKLQKEADEAYGVLFGRCQVLHDAFSSMGARLTLMNGQDLLEFMQAQTRGEDNGPAPTLFKPVSLEVGGYAKLSQEKLNKVLAAQQKVRAASKQGRGVAAPPAVGVGDLTLADKISPAAVRIESDHVRIGDRFHATIFVYDWPPDLGFGDLSSLLNIPGRLKFAKYVTPVPQDKAVQTLGGAVAKLTAAEMAARDGNVITDQQRMTSLNAAQIAMHQLATGEQKLFNTTFLIQCEADTEPELKKLVDRIKSTLAAHRIDALLAQEEMWEGFVSTLPFAQNMLTPKHADRGLLTNPLACLFVHGSYQVDHEDGVLMGIDPYTGGLVVLDQRELVNPNMVILGTSGGGKTVTVKALSTRQRMRGRRVVIIDPEGNSGYGRVAKRIDGEYVVFGVGSDSKFNPCDLRDNYLNLDLLSSISQEDDDEQKRAEAIKRARGAALDHKCLNLTRLVSLMISGDDGKGGLSESEWGPIERVWRETYAELGITNDPETHSKTPPTMTDFFAKLAEIAKGETERPAEVLNDVRGKLYSWEHGSLRGFFAEQTNVNLDNRYLVMQIAGVRGREKAAIMYALLDFLNGRLSDRTEPSACYIDEFWSLLKYPMAADFVEEMFRTGRARNNSMVAITQEIVEFLNSGAGKVILSVAACQLFLKQKKKTADILDQFADLSPEQKHQLTTAQKGEGTLVVEDNQVPLYVVCSPSEHRLFNTDPKKEEQYKTSDAQAREEEKLYAERHSGGAVTPGSAKAPAREPVHVAANEKEPLAYQSGQPSNAALQELLSEASQLVAQAPTDTASSAHPTPGHPATTTLPEPPPHKAGGPSLEASGEDPAGGASGAGGEAPHPPGPELHDARGAARIGDGTHDTNEKPAGDPGGDANQGVDHAQEPSSADGDPRPGSETPASPDEESPIAGLRIPEFLPGEAPVHAVTGSGATQVAYNLAGLAAVAGREEGRRVLFVDAQGTASREIFDAFGQQRPDELLRALAGVPRKSPEGEEGVAAEDLSLAYPYVLTDPETTLSVVAAPEDAALSPAPLVEQAKALYDCILVTCGEEPSPYAKGWLSETQPGTVVAAAPEVHALLEAATISEEAACSEEREAILAPMGILGDDEEHDFSGGRALNILPRPDDPAFEEAAQKPGSFATLTDPEVGRIFRSLLLEMLARATQEATTTEEAIGQ